MPLVRITAPDSLDRDRLSTVAHGVHQALVDTVGIPGGDRFQLLVTHAPEVFAFDPDYLDVAASVSSASRSPSSADGATTPSATSTPVSPTTSKVPACASRTSLSCSPKTADQTGRLATGSPNSWIWQ